MPAFALPVMVVACLEPSPGYAGGDTGTLGSSAGTSDTTGGDAGGTGDDGGTDATTGGSADGNGTNTQTGTQTGTGTQNGTGTQTGTGTGGIEDGLLLYLPLDGDANDASGNGMHGALQGESGDEWIAGHVGAQALELDGSDEFVETVEDSWATFMNDYTVAFWVDAAPSQQGWSAFYTKGENDWSLGFNVQATVIEVCHAGTVYESGLLLSELGGAWHHVAVVREGVTMHVYRDGSLVTTFDGAGPRTGPGTLKLGASRDGNRTIEAKLDDFRVYDRALGPTQIQQLADMG